MTAAVETTADLRKLSLFGTPLAVQVMPEAAALNAALRPALSALLTAAPREPGEASRSAFELEGPAAEALAAILERAIALAEAMAGSATSAWSPDVVLEVLSPGQGVAIGSAPEVAWCARYVLDDGGSSAQRDFGARFEAQDPRGVGPVMYAPHLTIADPAGPTLGISQTVGLKSGAILVYPGWLLHGVEPYSGPEAFVSLLLQLRR